jgi:hypothetical protein
VQRVTVSGRFYTVNWVAPPWQLPLIAISIVLRIVSLMLEVINVLARWISRTMMSVVVFPKVVTARRDGFLHGSNSLDHGRFNQLCIRMVVSGADASGLTPMLRNRPRCAAF